MKQYILTLLCLLTYLTMLAQEPTETLFSVNALTEDGRDTTFVVSSVNVNSFSFFGGKRMVTNPENGQEMNVDNADLYAFIAEKTPEKFVIKTIVNPDMDFSEMGYCLSKKSSPQISAGKTIDLEKTNTTTVNGIEFDECGCNISELTTGTSIPSDEVFVFYNKNKNDNKHFYPLFSGLELGSLFYVRPFVRFSNGEVMYGSETSFAVYGTMQQTAETEEEMNGWSVLSESQGVMLSANALQQVYNAYQDDFGSLDKSKKGISNIMAEYLSSRDCSDLKENAQSVQCYEGPLYVVNDVSKDFIDGFRHCFLTSTKIFSPTSGNVYFDDDNAFTNLTNTEIHDVSCDAKWYVPDNHYLIASPLTSNRNTEMTLNIPVFLLANQTYSIEILFAPETVEEPDGLPSQLRFAWYVSTPSGDTPKNSSPAVKFMNGTSQNFQIPNSGKCESVVIEYTPEYITSLNMLKCQSYVLSSQTSKYSKAIRIAQIRISPNN